jgi:hypothetical protein
MDGLDVYIGDYTQPDPIPDQVMKRLLHTRHIFNPPKTEVNAEGHVVDVVEQADAEAADATAAMAAPDRADDASPEPLPTALDESAEPDKIPPASLRGNATS